MTSASSPAIADAETGVAPGADARMRLGADMALAHGALANLRPQMPDEATLAATDHPVSMIRWTTGACGPVDTPTGLTGRSGEGATAIVEWDFGGPTTFYLLPRKSATQSTWPDRDDLQYMFVGAWKVPGITGGPSIAPLPASGTPTTVQVADDLVFLSEFPVQYKLCGQDWTGTPRRCTDAITVPSIR